MNLTLTVPPYLYAQLLDPATRRAFERELALICRGYVRLDEMRDGGREWRRGGNGHKRSTITVEKAEIQPQGLTCSLRGG